MVEEQASKSEGDSRIASFDSVDALNPTPEETPKPKGKGMRKYGVTLIVAFVFVLFTDVVVRVFDLPAAVQRIEQIHNSVAYGLESVNAASLVNKFTNRVTAGEEGLVDRVVGIPGDLASTLGCAWNGADTCKVVPKRFPLLPNFILEPEVLQEIRSNWFGKSILILVLVVALAITVDGVRTAEGDSRATAVLAFPVVLIQCLVAATVLCLIAYAITYVFMAVGNGALTLTSTFAGLSSFPLIKLLFDTVKDLASDRVKGFAEAKIRSAGKPEV